MSFKPQFEPQKFDLQAQRQQKYLTSAKQWGIDAANSYPAIWDPFEQVKETLTSQCKSRVDTELAEFKPEDSGWFGGIAIAALWIAGIWVPISSGNWWYFFLFGVLGWLVLFGTIGSAAAKGNKYDALHEQVLKVAVRSALQTFEARKTAAVEYQPEVKQSHEGFSPKGPMPVPAPYGVSHEGAETLVAHWMRFLGEDDAEVTSFTGDGGIDVQSLHYIAQVKNYKGSVSVAEVRQLQGVASADGRKPLFFTSGTYTFEGLKFAETVGMAMFIYNAEEGTLTGACSRAKQLLESGL